MLVDDLSGRLGSDFAYWGSGSSGLKLRVDQHNVMKAAKIVMAEAERFRRRAQSHLAGLNVDEVGGDPVSAEAALVLNKKLWNSNHSYYARFLQYADMLEGLAYQLGEAARTYGRTEEEVESMFVAARQNVQPN